MGINEFACHQPRRLNMPTIAEDMREEPDLRCIQVPKVCRLSKNGVCTCVDESMAGDCPDRLLPEEG